jgi:DNA ligase (NAD+)
VRGTVSFPADLAVIKAVLDIEGVGEALWRTLMRRIMEHLFSWLALTQAQLQATPGISPHAGRALASV